MKFPISEIAEFRKQMLGVESSKNLSPWERLIVTPPILVRLMARTRDKNPRALSDLEISANGGFKPSELPKIYGSLIWNVTMPNTRRFLEACNMDIMKRDVWNILIQYVLRRRPRWSHLKRDGGWETTYEPMLKAWENAMDYVR